MNAIILTRRPHLHQLCALDVPQPHRAVVSCGGEQEAARAEHHAEDNRGVSSEHGKGLEGSYVPQPDLIWG